MTLDRIDVARGKAVDAEAQWPALTGGLDCCEAARTLRAALMALRAAGRSSRCDTMASARLAFFCLAGVHDLAKSPGLGQLSAELGPLDSDDLALLHLSPASLGLGAGESR